MDNDLEAFSELVKARRYVSYAPQHHSKHRNISAPDDGDYIIEVPHEDWMGRLDFDLGLLLLHSASRGEF